MTEWQYKVIKTKLIGEKQYYYIYSNWRTRLKQHFISYKLIGNVSIYLNTFPRTKYIHQDKKQGGAAIRDDAPIRRNAVYCYFIKKKKAKKRAKNVRKD